MLDARRPSRPQRPAPSALSIAIVGATGLVGEALLRVLEERHFPVSRVRLLASARSKGAALRFRGETLRVEETHPALFERVDVAFFAATGALSRDLAPEAARRGAVVVDKSAGWRMADEVPLVVPEVNGYALEKHQGIIASPNCTTAGVVMALEPIRRAAGLRDVVITTLQAATGAGREGGEELEHQTARVATGERLVDFDARIFPRPLVHNVVPLCERFRDDGSSTEEWKLVQETRKILGLPELRVAATCVRVPVPVGHSASVLVETERGLSADDARRALAAFPGVRVMDDPPRGLLPTPADAAGRDEVLVGRVRADTASGRLWLWQVADNLRKGAATNAVQIAEALVERGLL
jgi:aspartate-semialdehyde dehydrogenase